jgi:magnesium transporter
MTLYRRGHAGFSAGPMVPEGQVLPQDAVWIDAVRPTEAELAWLSASLGAELPTQEDMGAIETSSRLYWQGEAAVLTTPIMIGADKGRLEMGTMAFIVTPRALVTLRHADPPWLVIFAVRALKNQDLVKGPQDVFFGLLEAAADRIADTLEHAALELDGLSRRIFAQAQDVETDIVQGSQAIGRRRSVRKVRRGVSQAAHNPKALMTAIGGAGDTTQKARDSLAAMERLCAFVASAMADRLSKDYKTRLKTLSRDVRSLAEHANFQSAQTSFLLDATLGLINIQQTNIIKIFSVASAVFLPPTLIASLYGMNFELMPELDWPWGYPAALALMTFSALLPLWRFRRQGWL